MPNLYKYNYIQTGFYGFLVLVLRLTDHTHIDRKRGWGEGNKGRGENIWKGWEHMKGRPNWETELLKCFERYNKKKGKWNKDIRSGYNHMGRLPSLPPP